MKHVYVYIGIGIAVVIIGTFLIFQLGSKQPEQATYIQKSMNVTDVIHNLDSLYDKRIIVSGYWYDTYYSPVPDLQCRQVDPNMKPTYDNSTYEVASFGGNNYLFTAKSYTGKALLVSLPNPNKPWLFNDPVNNRGEFVTVSGILEKTYNTCLGSHYYKSAILQADSLLQSQKYH